MENDGATKSDIANLERRLVDRIEKSEANRERRVVDRIEKTEANLEERLRQRIGKMETTLLKEFRKCAISFESRFRANEILVGGFNERLVGLEERVSDIERKSES